MSLSLVHRRLLIAAVAAFLHALAPGETSAQDARITVIAREPAVAIRKIQSGDPDSIFSGFTVAWEAFRSNRSKYTAERLQELLEGLELTAAGDFVGSEEQVESGMLEAYSVLMGLVRDSTVRALEGEEVPARLIRIYRNAARLNARGMAIMGLGNVLCYGGAHAEEVGILLVEIAKRQHLVGEVSPWVAVDALKAAGENGRPLLRQLYQSGEVLDQGLAVHLDRLSQADFPLADSAEKCGF